MVLNDVRITFTDNKKTTTRIASKCNRLKISFIRCLSRQSETVNFHSSKTNDNHVSILAYCNAYATRKLQFQIVCLFAVFYFVVEQKSTVD